MQSYSEELLTESCPQFFSDPRGGGNLHSLGNFFVSVEQMNPIFEISASCLILLTVAAGKELCTLVCFLLDCKVWLSNFRLE